MSREDADRYEVGTSPFQPQPRPTARLKSPVRQQFDDNRLTDRLGDDHFFPTVSRAVEWCSASSPED